jgi:hypothetical protein|tara:strand:- start:11389 stop:12039 length:651 start_codon:yes stop_codon:yes gene_type:complete
MNIAVVAGHLAFGLIAFSFLVKDILWLRIVSIVASLFSVFYNWVIPVEPMWIPIGWNFVFVLLNLYHIAIIVYEKRPVDMSPKHKELYETMFKNMTPVEFLKITKIADWIQFKSGELITQKGHTVSTLNLIYNGTVDVAVEGKKVAELKDGQFVGEMSFLTEKPATATCVVKHDTECLVWKQEQFKDLLKRNPSLYFTIQGLLSAQVSSALVSSNK